MPDINDIWDDEEDNESVRQIMAMPLQQAIAEKESAMDNSDKDIAGLILVKRDKLRALIDAAEAATTRHGHVSMSALAEAIQQFKGEK